MLMLFWLGRVQVSEVSPSDADVRLGAWRDVVRQERLKQFLEDTSSNQVENNLLSCLDGLGPDKIHDNFPAVKVTNKVVQSSLLPQRIN